VIEAARELVPSFRLSPRPCGQPYKGLSSVVPRWMVLLARLMPLRVRQSQGVANCVSALPGAHRRCVGAEKQKAARGL